VKKSQKLTGISLPKKSEELSRKRIKTRLLEEIVKNVLKNKKLTKLLTKKK
jgi:hypothetical protein